MPGKKRKSGQHLYARLLHEVSQINRELPEDKQLSLQDRRKWLSQEIYPRYKGKPAYTFRITEARETIRRKIKRLPKRTNTDPNFIPEELYDEIDYYAIDTFYAEVLKDWAIFTKVVAGTFGETSVFNTRDYNYQTTGLADITNSINKFVRESPRKIVSGKFFYSGFVQVRPGHANDLKPDSYYLEMILHKGNVSAKKIEPVILPPPKTKAQKERRKKKKKKAKEIIDNRTKKIKFVKSKVKRIRQDTLKAIQFFKSLLKVKYISTKEKKAYAKKAFTLEKQKLDRHLKAGTINDRRYQELLAKIKKGYGQKG